MVSLPKESILIETADSAERQYARDWYEQLEDLQVKASISLIRFQSVAKSGARRMIVCCWQFPDLRKAGTPFVRQRRLFDEWTATSPAIHGRGPVSINWTALAPAWPGSSKTDSPRDKHRWAMDSQALDDLELLHFARISDQGFAKIWENSNEPFLSAGRIASGKFQWINEFPAPWPAPNLSPKQLQARLKKHAREFLGLHRMAAIARHRSPLTDHLSREVKTFCREMQSEAPRLRRLFRRHFSSPGQQRGPNLLFQPGECSLISQIAGILRTRLAEKSTSLAHEIPAMVNSFLPARKVPESAAYFTETSQD